MSTPAAAPWEKYSQDDGPWSKYGDSSGELTQQTNAAASAAGVQNPGVAKIPVPNPADPHETPIGQPIAPIGAAASIPRAALGLAGGYGGAMLGKAISSNPWVRDAGAVAGGLLGEGTGAAIDEPHPLMRGVAKDVANKYLGKTAGDTIFKPPVDMPSEGTGAPLPHAPTDEENLTRAVKEGRAAKLPTRMPRPAKPAPPSPFQGMTSSNDPNLPPAPTTIGKSIEPNVKYVNKLGGDISGAPQTSPEAARADRAVAEAKASGPYGYSREEWLTLNDDQKARAAAHWEAAVNRSRVRGTIHAGRGEGINPYLSNEAIDRGK